MLALLSLVARLCIHIVRLSLRIFPLIVLCSFTDFGFLPTSHSVDIRRFPHHQEVQLFLEDFASTFHLHDVIQFNQKVVSARALHSSSDSSTEETSSSAIDGWQVRSRDVRSGCEEEREHSALVVSNGHYSNPFVPNIAGQSEFPGLQLHTHNYRRPDAQYADKRIIVLGASASGEDISRELASVARDVYLCQRGMPHATEDGHTPRLWQHGSITELRKDGSVLFDNGETLQDVDVIMYATGYSFNVDFLEDENGSNVCETGNNWIWPLYEHVLHAEYGRKLSFIGVPVKVVPFPQMELQSRWVAKMLSGAIQPPSTEELQRERQRLEQEVIEPNGSVAKRHAHVLGPKQFSYNDRLSELIGERPLPSWRERMHTEASKVKREIPADYKDAASPVSEELLAEAHADLYRADPRFSELQMEQQQHTQQKQCDDPVNAAGIHTGGVEGDQRATTATVTSAP
jgi:hypothetical protein